MWKRVLYKGESVLTRGNFGETVFSGRMSPSGFVYVWDSSYGWFNWGVFNDIDWIVTPQEVEPVEVLWDGDRVQ